MIMIETGRTGWQLEEVMQPFLVLPNGMTVNQWMSPQIEEVYRLGQMPAMLPGATESRETYG